MGRGFPNSRQEIATGEAGVAFAPSWLWPGRITPSHSHWCVGALTANSLCQAIKRRAKRVGVTGPVNPHAFRHGFAKHYLMSGGDLASVPQLMDHESLEITMDCYVQYTVSELQQKHQEHSPVAEPFELHVAPPMNAGRAGGQETD